MKTKITKQKFDQLIQKTFNDKGGEIFQNYYECALINEWTLKDIADEIKYDLESERNRKLSRKIKNKNINSINECCTFLSKYLNVKNCLSTFR